MADCSRRSNHRGSRKVATRVADSRNCIVEVVAVVVVGDKGCEVTLMHASTGQGGVGVTSVRGHGYHHQSTLTHPQTPALVATTPCSVAGGGGGGRTPITPSCHCGERQRNSGGGGGGGGYRRREQL